jgi:Rod binding domain-containing protein
MTINGVGSAAPAAGPRKDTPEKTIEAAQQFESLLIAQMLRTMRESGSGWFGTGDDSAGSTGIEMAETHFATLLASRGGLGLARMVAQGLRREGIQTANPGDAASPRR